MNAPQGITTLSGVNFLTDTGNALVRKTDANNGAFFSEQAAITNPFRIKNDGTYLYITDKAASKLYKYQNDLNLLSQVWVKNNATSSTDLTLAATYILVSDPDNNKVYLYRQTDGTYAYEFGDTATNDLQEPYGLAIIGNDLYIVERTLGRITRIRSHGW